MKRAFIFPGQGSQSVAMLADLADAYPAVRQTFAEASQALGWDLWKITQAGPAEELNRTDRTQPAMLAAGVAVWRVWREQGGAEPVVMAGHSLGEYTALVCAGALELTEAAPLVADRGRYMQEAVPDGQGAMAAILGLNDDAVIALCTQAANGQVVEAVNFNSPGQVVIAGEREAVARAMAAAKEAGAKRALELPVSVPSHCALMRPAADRLAQRLAQVALRTPRVPVINNVDVAAVSEPAAIRDALVRQLYSPVRWSQSVLNMAGGVERFVECGPGKVLTGLSKRIVRDVEAVAVHDPSSLQAALKP